MKTFITPPARIPWLIRIIDWAALKVTGKRMDIVKLMSHFPRGAYAALIFEAGIATPKHLDGRLLKLLRLKTGATIGCPFCFDMNSQELDKFNITTGELEALGGVQMLGAPQSRTESLSSFSKRETVALEYTERLTRTPQDVTVEFMAEVKQHFSEREIAVIVYTVAQVNFWSRMTQGLGIPPAGFTDVCQNIPIRSR